MLVTMSIAAHVLSTILVIVGIVIVNWSIRYG